MARTRFTAATGIEIRRTPDNRWRHVDTNDGRNAEVGPDYHSKGELLSDHEAYLKRAGWLKAPAPAGERALVVVGAPFEQQTMYGPFEDHDAAAKWADETRNDYTWILTLHAPTEVPA